LETTKEFKTKPTQHSVKELRAIGIHPDIIICRSREPLTFELREKISLFCDVAKDAVISLSDMELLYEVPLALERERLDEIVVKYLDLLSENADLDEWKSIVEAMKKVERTLKIAIVGKYTELRDSYISIVESLKHGGIANNSAIEILWVNAESLELAEDIDAVLRGAQGILVPGGFGIRGIEGKIKAIKYARENKIPFLGLCLGMQCAVIEFARNVLKLEGAHSSEFDPQTKFPVIDLLPEQKDITEKGGTMRLGAYPCKVKKDTLLFKAYNEELVNERHRHRYEFNNQFREKFEEAGLICSGIYEKADLVEVIEYRDHPWFLATQYHPEFKSRPNRPHPIFRDFIKAAAARLAEQETLW
jgi:CTP synthase